MLFVSLDTKDSAKTIQYFSS